MNKKIKVLVDTNVIIDVLSQRQPFFVDSKKILILAEKGSIDAYITASSITDIVYLLGKYFDKEKSQKITQNLIKTIKVIPVTGIDIEKAFNYNFKDFEDALQAQCAGKLKIDYIITRNKKDFKSASIKTFTPTEFLLIE